MKIEWTKINRYKKKILEHWRKEGKLRTVYYVEGILGLQYGELIKNRKKILKYLNQIKK